MKRAFALGLLLIATAVSAPASARESLGSKPQWAPSGNFSALHARAVFRGETETAARPYARESRETAAASGIFLSRDPTGASSYLHAPNGLGPWSYANLSPARYTDPDGRFGLGLESIPLAWERWFQSDAAHDASRAISERHAGYQRAVESEANFVNQEQDAFFGGSGWASAAQTGGTFGGGVFFGVPRLLVDRSWVADMIEIPGRVSKKCGAAIDADTGGDWLGATAVPAWECVGASSEALLVLGGALQGAGIKGPTIGPSANTMRSFALRLALEESPLTLPSRNSAPLSMNRAIQTTPIERLVRVQAKVASLGGTTQAERFAAYMEASRNAAAGTRSEFGGSIAQGAKGMAAPGRVGLDTGAAINLVADDAAVRAATEAVVNGRQVVMSRTVRAEFRAIVERWGGPLERARAETLLSNAQHVGDNLSGRARTLRPTGNIEASDIDVFGTYDWLDIETITADSRAIRASRAQGVNFNTRRIDPAQLTGR